MLRMLDMGVDFMILRAAAVLLALALHEYAHAVVAVRLGDPGPKFAGRLTLNPLPHLDPIGTIMLFLFSFGWAKPVIVDPRRFENPRRDMMWVALAGPVSNILFAMVLYRIWPVLLPIVPMAAQRATQLFFTVAIQLNVWLAVFNMLPLPPLDGSKVLAGILPARYAYRYMQIERYGMFILLLLVMTGMIGRILTPIFSIVMRLVVW